MGGGYSELNYEGEDNLSFSFSFVFHFHFHIS
jgi:hypothetical protein